MATSTFISASEYLVSSFRPDCELVDGELQERNVGEFEHGTLQGAVFAILFAKRQEWHIRVVLELRVQVRADRFRIPDVCVLSADAPKERVIRHAPLLCIEILSPEDRLSRMKDRIRDFIAMGVRQVWIFDPEARTATVCDGVTMTEHREGEIALPGTPIVLSLAEAFSVLDEA